MSLEAAAVTSTTARLNASSFALDGLLKPLSLRTNCSAEARISASVAGGSKLNSVLMLRHMKFLRLDSILPGYFVTACRVVRSKRDEEWPPNEQRRGIPRHLAHRSFRCVPAV